MNKIRRKSEKNVLNWHGEKAVPYFTFPAFDELPGIIHGFSSRLGGVSEGFLSSMNLSFSRGDEPERVRENFRRIAESIGFSEKDLVFSMQTHTANVRRVGREDCGRGLERPVGYCDVDGLVTNEPGVVLATFYADCVPLFFVDPVHHCIGLSHSGWRGTVGKIGKATVEAMAKEFGSEPGDLLAAVGPSICQECYEVSEEVIGLFRENFAEELWPKLFYRKDNGHYQLNLWEANRLIFQEAGILPQHITVTDICTACNPELLFSHRASGGKRGNLAGFLEIKA
ncbi:peptidoglycan editing factor PgeF [Blautia sp. OF03-15BH]|uniref:peptidoglycan editing factor PgeF n=1 Tax=Blautia sp. OF03-15BH TaxID=2292287 RepID=UPI000E550CD5|nr:peptidoglycan editing factor PgeF [Blautia sp. OF03-15BH]RGY02306.1 peptidoglycan editing factor PgeF [Blautia sp. OF03-15BH]